MKYLPAPPRRFVNSTKANTGPIPSPPKTSVFSSCKKEELVGGTPAQNAEITRSILKGEKGPKRNAVLLNAGAALYIGGKAVSFKDGITLAAELIDNGSALSVLDTFAAESRS